MNVLHLSTNTYNAALEPCSPLLLVTQIFVKRNEASVPVLVTVPGIQS